MPYQYTTDPHDLAVLRSQCEAGFHVVPGMALALLDALERARDTAALLESELEQLRPVEYAVPTQLHAVPDPDRWLT